MPDPLSAESPDNSLLNPMAFKLMMSAQKKWRKLDGQNRLPEVIAGVEFRDGVRHLQNAA